MPLRLADRVISEMEDRRGKHRGRAAIADAFDQMIERADAARGDHGHRHGVRNCTRKRNIEAGARAIPVHRRQEDFACAKADNLFRKLYGVDARPAAPAMSEDLPPRLAFTTVRNLLRVDGHDDALVAELLRRARDERPVRDRGGVDRNLVGASPEKLAHIVQRAYAATHGQRHEAAFRRARNDIEDGAPFFMTCGDVQKTELVRSGLIVGRGRLDGVSGVAKVHKVHPLHHAPIFHVEAGNDAHFQHRSISG